MIEKVWACYLKLVAIAPLAGILCLWMYLKGSHISLVGFIGASSHILIAIALVGMMSIVFSGVTLWLAIWLPFRSEIARIIVSAMQRRTLLRNVRRRTSKRRPLYWLTLIYVIPCFLGVILGWYVGSGKTIMLWLWGIGLPPSLVAWFLLLRCDLGRRLQPFYALMTLLIIAVITTSVTLILFLSVQSVIPFVPYVRGQHIANSGELILYHGSLVIIAATLSVGMTMLLAPTTTGRSSTLKLVIATVLICMTAFLRSTPVYIVQAAFVLFASGGEHRVYTSLKGAALEIPLHACADKACLKSRPIRITADLGNVVYATYDYPETDGAARTSSLMKLDMSKATYEVLHIDAPIYSELQIL